MKKTIFTLLFLSVLAFFSCEEILMEKDISDKTVVLVAPVDHAQFASTGIGFTWETVEDATAYRLQIAKPSFANPVQIVLDTLVSSGTAFTYQLNTGEFEWRVKAVNSGYETGYSSRFFTIASNDDFESNIVVLQSPANNLVTNSVTQNLSWLAVPDAVNYQVQIYDASNVLVTDQTTANSTYGFTFPEGSYSWRVRAGNGTVHTLFSSRAILVDTTPPNTPTLTVPVTGNILSGDDVTFQWTRTAIPGSVEKDSIYIYNNSTLTDLEFKDLAQTPYTKSLDSGAYYWYIKSFDAAGNVSVQSTVSNFILNN